MSDPTLEEVVADIELAVKELEEYSQFDSTEAWERIKRWKERTVRKLIKLLNDREAQKFQALEVVWRNAIPKVAIAMCIKEQRGFLLGLIEDIKTHPDDYSRDSVYDAIPGGTLDPAYDGLFKLLHKTIRSITKGKFIGADYSGAAYDAMKAVNLRVKDYYKNTQGIEKDGVDLMRAAFSPNRPIVVVGDIATETGENMQRGYMDIFSGSMSAIRNPKAHDFISIDALRCVHFLTLASLLMHKLDDASVPEFVLV